MDMSVGSCSTLRVMGRFGEFSGSQRPLIETKTQDLLSEKTTHLCMWEQADDSVYKS